MERPEVPLEQVHEDIHHHSHNQGSPRWSMGVALSSALLAGLAAISSLLAGDHVNEAMIDNIKGADMWSQYQAKSIKKNVLESKIELLVALEKPIEPKDRERVARYESELGAIKHEAEEKEQAAKAHLHRHEIFARAVTMFQVAIAVAAIAVLTRLLAFWWVGLGFGGIGVYFFVQAFMAQSGH